MNTTTTVYIDDFDPILSYANPLDWTTPDPSENPSWYRDADVTEYHQATWHHTSVSNASLSLNFTGSSIKVYGTLGPSFGARTVALQPQDRSSAALLIINRTSTDQNATRSLLFDSDSSNTRLTYGDWNLKLSNGDAELEVDLIVVGGIVVGGPGASLTNTTIEESDSRLTYTGMWGNNTVLSGGTTYTNGEGASVSFSFSGSALYMYGDQVNDHGLFSVTLNESRPVISNGRSGCGEPFGKTCEKLGGLHYFVGGLPEGEHRVRVENIPGEDGTYLDIENFIYTTPSVYPSLSSSSNSSPPSNPASSSRPSPSAGASSTGGTSAATLAFSMMGPAVWLGLAVGWIANGMRLV